MARLHAAPREPPRIGLAKVIATLGIGRVALAEGRPPELAAPGDQRVGEQAALFEVLHERRRRALRVAALRFELREQVAMLVPTGVHQLHEPRTPLEQPPRDQTVGGEAALHVHVGPVAVEHVLGFVRKIDQVGHARLHPVGHLVLRDPRVDLRIAVVGQMGRVHGGDVVEQRPSRLAAHACRIRQIRHRVARVAKPHALEPARQKAAAPVVVEEELTAALLLVGGGHHHEGRQFVGVAAEAVAHPRAHARPARHLRPRHEKGHARGVVHRFGVHAPHQADLVGDAADAGQHLAHLDARFAVLPEALDRRDDRPLGIAARHRREPCAAADALGDILATAADQRRLGIKQVDVRRPASLPEHDDPLRRGRMMRQPWQAGRRSGLSHIARCRCVAVEQRRQRDRADAQASRAEEPPAGEKGDAALFCVHHWLPFLERDGKELRPLFLSGWKRAASPFSFHSFPPAFQITQIWWLAPFLVIPASGPRRD